MIREVELRKGVLGTSLSIPLEEDGSVVLRATRHSDAEAFSEQLNTAWVTFNLAALEKEAARFDWLHEAIA